MEPRLNVITLGVADVARARAFYEQLGWQVAFTDGDIDALGADAAEAGATVTRAPVEKPFGYSGVFADLDGHTWEIAWIKGLTRDADGSVSLAS
jgi:predicted lactoylglutathione lyase